VLRTRFTDLVGCAVPLQNAGMGWVAGPELAAAVAGAGGLGMVSMPLLPIPALTPLLDDLVRRAAGPVGMNFIVPFLDPDAVAVAARRLRVVEFSFGDPDPQLVAEVHREGALAAWQMGSPEQARAAADAGCDLVVAQGAEAGGHLCGGTALTALLSEVLAVVDVPVVAAGGIGTARAVAAALAAGASAVRVGTRFVAAAEADAHPEYVEALVAAGPEDTVRTTAFSEMWPDAPHRVLRSSIARATATDRETVGETMLGGRTMPVPRLAPMAPIRSTTGDIAAMPLYAGHSVAAVRAVQPAAEIVRELIEGAERLLPPQPSPVISP
jgi:NAD(P)H-dependent flavin oxidoreductase YrpB (nitropropane dioxygenase family)